MDSNAAFKKIYQYYHQCIWHFSIYKGTILYYCIIIRLWIHQLLREMFGFSGWKFKIDFTKQQTTIRLAQKPFRHFAPLWMGCDCCSFHWTYFKLKIEHRATYIFILSLLLIISLAFYLVVKRFPFCEVSSFLFSLQHTYFLNHWSDFDDIYTKIQALSPNFRNTFLYSDGSFHRNTSNFQSWMKKCDVARWLLFICSTALLWKKSVCIE